MNLTKEKATIFINDVQTMRKYQNLYFKTPNIKHEEKKAYLIRSKEAEKKVDEFLKGR